MAAGLIMVQQYQRMVIQRFGTYTGTKTSGLHFLIPFVYHGTKVDLRERVARVPTQKYITADNVVVDMDFVIYYRVMETMADRAVLEVQNFELAVVNLAFATLRAVHRRNHAGRGAGRAGAHPRRPASAHGRGHRALGRQGLAGRDQRDRPAARRQGRHGT